MSSTPGMNETTKPTTSSSSGASNPIRRANAAPRVATASRATALTMPSISGSLERRAPRGAGRSAVMTWLTGMRVAVTGASGFCGGAVARAAADAGADVVCVGRRPGPVGGHVRWDAAAERPDLAGADAVLHLAAAVGDPGPGRAVEAAFRAVNVGGTARLLEAAGQRPVVWVGSASAYRPGPYAGPVTEDHPRDGQRSAYGRTKAAGDRLALEAGAVVLRPRAVYGAGDRHLRS